MLALKRRTYSSEQRNFPRRQELRLRLGSEPDQPGRQSKDCGGHWLRRRARRGLIASPCQVTRILASPSTCSTSTMSPATEDSNALPRTSRGRDLKRQFRTRRPISSSYGIPKSTQKGGSFPVGNCYLPITRRSPSEAAERLLLIRPTSAPQTCSSTMSIFAIW